MKSLKNHISVIFPLIVFLLSLQFTISLERIVDGYESKLVEDYSIIVVSVKKLDPDKLQRDIDNFKSLRLMSTRKVLEKLKGDISLKNLSLLQVALPKFYSLKLTKFPSKKQLDSLKKKLNQYAPVSKVETFSKTHNKIYRIFTIAKITSYIFTIFILIISLLLMLKQMRIWVYEHRERMDIMALFGAPFWMKSAVLYRLVIIDSIIATIIVIAIYYLLPYVDSFNMIASDIEVAIPQINVFVDGLFLLSVALVSAIFSVSLVMLRLRKA